MKKQSKITVKHYLNTNLKPDDGKYPLYVSITVNRETIRFKSSIEPYFSIEYFKTHEISKTNFLLIENELKIYEIITRKLLNDIENNKISMNTISNDIEYYSKMKISNKKTSVFTYLLTAYIAFFSQELIKIINKNVSDIIQNAIFKKSIQNFVFEKKGNNIQFIKEFKISDFLYNLFVFDRFFIFNNFSIDIIEYELLFDSFSVFCLDFKSKNGYNLSNIDWNNDIFKSYKLTAPEIFKKLNLYEKYKSVGIVFDENLIENQINIVTSFIENEYLELIKKN